MIETSINFLTASLQKALFILILPISILILLRVGRKIYNYYKTPTPPKQPKSIPKPKLSSGLPNEVPKLSPLKLVKKDAFGQTELDWLQSYHLFNFGKFRLENNDGFGFCRSFNYETIFSNGSYEPLKKVDYQIIYFVIRGSLTHRDHLNNDVTLKSNSVGMITGGPEGLVHVASNESPLDVQYLTMWFAPNSPDLPANFDYNSNMKMKSDGFTPLVTPNSIQSIENPESFVSVEPTDGTLGLNSDTHIVHFHLLRESSLVYEPKLAPTADIKAGRKVIVYVIDDASNPGEIVVNYENSLKGGDAALILARKGIENRAEDVILYNLSDKEMRGIIVDMA